jgi:predicted ATPase/DNA-binding SARP family transcriptional activator
MEPTPSLQVDVLGPLAVRVDDVAVEVTGPRRRGILVLLALAQGRTVTDDQFLEALWPTATPEAGRGSLHSSVSRLRQQLGPVAARLTTHAGGYRLQLEDHALDLERARELLATARAKEADQPRQAFETLRQARALWRGPVLVDLDDILPIAAAAQEAERLFRIITDALIDCAIRVGSAAEVVGIASDAVRREPLREGGVLLLMRALAADGRSVEALDAARELRARLADETGLDASPRLEALQRALAAGAAGEGTRAPGATPLPSQHLYGREADRTALQGLLHRDRLVTIVGPGGVGKTSLALAVAGESTDVVIASLAIVQDPAAVPHTLAAALGLHGVKGDVLAGCVAFLADRSALLVLDNCEHLLDAVRDAVALLLTGAPTTRILATSREPIGHPLEQVLRLAPLALPETEHEPRHNAAVALFLDRAQRARRGIQVTGDDLNAVVEIVGYLDGLPLAIELAASRLSSFSIADLRRRLDRSLDLLGSGRPSSDARHRTLRATLSWSYELLDAPEQQLLRQLAAFADGIPLDAAEAIAAQLDAATEKRGQMLARLVDSSMLEPEFGDDGTRYRMLEIVRSYARDRSIAGGDADQADRGLLQWAVGFVTTLETALVSENEPAADRALRRELPNVRAAWRLAGQRGDLEAAVTMGIGLFDAIAYRDLTELRQWVTNLATDTSVHRHPRAAALLGTAAEAHYHAGNLDDAEDLARTGLALPGQEPDRWYCHVALSVVALARGALDDAVAHTRSADRAKPGRSDPRGVAALAAAYAGDLEDARRRNDEGLRLATSPSMRSWAAYVAGEIETLAAHHDRAQEHYAEAVGEARISGATFLTGVANVGLVAARSRGTRPREALPGYLEIIDYFARTANWTHLWTTLRNLAELLGRLGDAHASTSILAAAEQAPEAPAVIVSSQTVARGSGDTLDPNEVLTIARDAISRHLP